MVVEDLMIIIIKPHFDIAFNIRCRLKVLDQIILEKKTNLNLR